MGFVCNGREKEGGGVHIRVPAAENPELSNFYFKPEVGQNIAVYALTAARSSALQSWLLRREPKSANVLNTAITRSCLR